MSTNRVNAAIERLEDRQLFSSTLAPSAVEGDYKGILKATSGQTIEVKLIITSTSAEAEYGSLKGKITLTATEFDKIRKGTFDETFKVSGKSVVLDGKVTAGGEKISGTGSVGSTKGTFSFVKYAG